MTYSNWHVTWVRLRRFAESLYKDRENGLLFGVCAGLADRFDWNPTATRIVALIALVCAFMPTAFVYLVAGLALPNRKLRYRGGGDEDRFWAGGSGAAGRG